MNTPAEYTRETVRFIREHARVTPENELALLLGWEVDRLRRIARQHAIELLPMKVVAPAAPVAEPVPPSKFAAGDIEWSPASNELRRGGMVVTLPVIQGGVFEVLFHCWRGRLGAITGGALGARVGTGYPPKEAIDSLAKKLARLRIRIISAKGRGGGYHLEVEQ